MRAPVAVDRGDIVQQGEEGFDAIQFFRGAPRRHAEAVGSWWARCHVPELDEVLGANIDGLAPASEGIDRGHCWRGKRVMGKEPPDDDIGIDKIGHQGRSSYNASRRRDSGAGRGRDRSWPSTQVWKARFHTSGVADR